MNTTTNAKRILAYGDSITWGRVAKQFERYDSTTRWTGALQHTLGPDYEVIEEGLRSRMLAGENLFVPHRDGLSQFGPTLGSHLPLDLIIIFLGINDLNSRAHKTAAEIADGLNGYFETIDEWCDEFHMQKPPVLIVSPPHLDGSRLKPNSMFDDAAKSQQLAQHYKQVVEQNGAHFFDCAGYIQQDGEDGVHISGEAHKQLGEALAPVVIDILA